MNTPTPQGIMNKARIAHEDRITHLRQKEKEAQAILIEKQLLLFLDHLKNVLDLNPETVDPLIVFSGVVPYIELENVVMWFSSEWNNGAGGIIAGKRCEECNTYQYEGGHNTFITSWEDLGLVFAYKAPRCRECSKPKHFRTYSQVRFFIDERAGASDLQDRVNTWLHIGCPDAHPSVTTHVTHESIVVAVTFRAEEEVSHVKR